MHMVTVRLAVAAILAVIGVSAFIIALGYDFGSARRMGPGYFPVVLSAILTLLALCEIVSALMKPEAQDLDWRPMMAILAGVAGFAVTMYLFGLIPAFFVVIGFSVLSEPGYGWRPAFILASVTSLCAWLLFSRLLGMTMPLFQFGL
ncbi:tripartite tricarboxylate transporter TctB family protein [Antarctobacter sp.]|uniref:tripartite tricarboxylate transporter TctB family protein n=1 Tax=Antarctobacter sp. TaxID=1872577 RepID=UPI002B271573|nr:tripartite tricarboxylate transporter TctB family protein [Antarctobacter sp.]